LLSSVTPVPLVRVIDPAELMTMSSADPFATVDVLTGVVVDVPIVVAAVALASVSATSAGAMAVQASRCRMMSPLRPAPDFYARVQEGRCRIGISV
jgi:multisubunit Na+/H+ antiporter MnhC subunit